MRYLIILLIFLAGCAPARYTPEGKWMTAEPYFSNIDKDLKCSKCGAENSSIWLHSSVRVPKKNASEKVWKNFYKLFVDKKN